MQKLTGYCQYGPLWGPPRQQSWMRERSEYHVKSLPTAEQVSK